MKTHVTTTWVKKLLSSVPGSSVGVIYSKYVVKIRTQNSLSDLKLLGSPAKHVLSLNLRPEIPDTTSLAESQAIQSNITWQTWPEI